MAAAKQPPGRGASKMAEHIHDPPGLIKSRAQRYAKFMKDLLSGEIDAESLRELPNGRLKYKTKGSGGGPPSP